MSIENLLSQMIKEQIETNTLLYAIHQTMIIAVPNGDKKLKAAFKEQAEAIPPGVSIKADVSLAVDGDVLTERVDSPDKASEVPVSVLRRQPVAHTKDEVMAVFIKLNKAHGTDVVKGVLKTVGAKKILDIEESRYNEAVYLCEQALGVSSSAKKAEV